LNHEEYSNLQLSEVQVIFVRAALHAALTKITVIYAGAKRYRSGVIFLKAALRAAFKKITPNVKHLVLIFRPIFPLFRRG
jgi:hypothetical protein